MGRLSILAAAVVLIVGGCATQGRVFDDRVTRDFVVGQTTAEEAITALGAPRIDFTRPDGLRVVQWFYTRTVVIQPFRRSVSATFRDGRLASLQAPLKDEEISIF